MKNNVLVTVYCSMLRPVLEYCSVVYHTLITREESERIERLQRLSLKIIFGFGESYENLLGRAGITSLWDRREEAFLKFARNLSQHSRYSESWLPKKEATRSLRKEKKYEEFYARTERLFCSPLYKIRRLLNEDDFPAP